MLMKRLGSEETSVVVMRPMTPKCMMRSVPMGNPMVAVMIASFRLYFVSPWALMRLPVLRLPNAV